MATEYIQYNEKAWSSLIITMFCTKLVIMLILSLLFMTPSNTNVGENAINYIKDSSSKKTAGDVSLDYGEVTFASAFETDSVTGMLSNMVKFAFSTDDIRRVIEPNFGSIPYIIWFFLFDIWVYLLLLLAFIRTKFKI